LYTSIDKFDIRSNWWITNLVSNHFSRWYAYTVKVIREEQRAIEEDLFEAQEEIERRAMDMIENGKYMRSNAVFRASEASERTFPGTTEDTVDMQKVSGAEASSVVLRAAFSSSGPPQRRDLTDIKLTGKESAEAFLAKYHDRAATESEITFCL
jgi:hypothetical protein